MNFIQKNKRSHFIKYFLLASCVSIALGTGDLLASISVTSTTDAGGGTIPGTLSYAIDQVNENSNFGPIELTVDVTTSASMPHITTTLNMESSSTGTPYTINGNGSDSDILLYVSSGTTTLTSDIILNSSLAEVTGNASLILTGTGTNWNGSTGVVTGLTGVTLNSGTLGFSLTESSDFDGTISLSSSNTISLVSSESATLTMGGNITGTGSVTFEGSGLVLAGVNSWTGSATFKNASVQVTETASLPTSISLTLDTGSVLTFALPSSDFYTGSWSTNGDGTGVIEVASGTINFSSSIGSGIGELLFTGGSSTLINSCNVGSVIVVGGDVTFSGSISSNTVFYFYGGTTNIYTTSCSASLFNFLADVTVNIQGALNGSEGLILNSPNDGNPAGTLVLSGANTFNGTTLVGKGCTLEVSTGASFGKTSYPVIVNSKAYLVNDGTVTASLFSNFGDVTLSSGSTITVENVFYNYSGATVTGCGTIAGNYQAEGGSYTGTGCSPSPMAVTGDATFSSGSIFSPYLDSTGVAALNVSGDVTLRSGSTLEFRPEPGCYTNGETRVFLTADGSLTGTFSDVSMGTLLLVPNISYGANGVTLTIQKANLSDIVQGDNAKSVGKVLNLLIEEGLSSGANTFCDVVEDLFFLSQEGISIVLDQLHPALFKGFAIAAESSIVRVEEALIQRLKNELDEKHCRVIHATKDRKESCTKEKKMFHAWAAGIGDALNQKSTNYQGSPQVGYHENMGGAVAAIDAFFVDCLYAGVLGAYTSTDVKWNNNQGKGNIQSGYAGAYFSAIGDMFYGNASIIGSLNSYDAKRTVVLPASSYETKNNHGGSQLLSHLDTGVNLGWDWFTIRPFESFDYIAQKERGFTEEGAGTLDLSVKKSNSILLRNELGLNFAGCFCAAGSKWIISPKISWVREVRITGSSYTAKFVNTDTSFTVTGYFPDRSLVSPGVSVTGNMLEDRLTLTAYYNGELRGNYSNHSYGGEVRFGF